MKLHNEATCQTQDFDESYRNALGMCGGLLDDRAMRRERMKQIEARDAGIICGKYQPARKPYKAKTVLNAEAKVFRHNVYGWATKMQFEIVNRFYYGGRLNEEEFTIKNGTREVSVVCGDFCFIFRFWEKADGSNAQTVFFDHRHEGDEMPSLDWYKKNFQQIADFLFRKIDKIKE